MTPNDTKYVRRSRTEAIVVHCSATKPSMDIGAETIDRWHKDRGWLGIGYHFVIRRDGSVEAGRPTWAVGAHVEGHNSRSVGVCLVGGIDEFGHPQNNFTVPQMMVLKSVLTGLQAAYPDAEVYGHRDFTNKKACPSFDARAWWAEVNDE